IHPRRNPPPDRAGCDDAGRRTVLDADALTAFRDRPDELFDAIAGAAPVAGAADARPPDPSVVLTPHAGEFRRLFPDIARTWQAPGGSPAAPAARPWSGTPGDGAGQARTDGARRPRFSKVDAARAASARSGALVLLKGPDTVIGHPDGGIAIASAAYDRAAPWLATAGSGDVLAGLIAGLAARTPVLSDAVEDAAWLHVEAARRFGPGLIAEDIPEGLPAVFRDLGL
ncbi:hypothetical protein HKCCSP123_13175, partial [Rhodobacterales bacterium HKCCSP123]|nr:hypothetical protein [Rhodobacterales bacterium HKCCSP123]